MKKTALLIILFSTTFTGKGQNLVPNGSFEDTLAVPTSHSQFENYVSGWINPTTGSPDYFHQNSTSMYVQVPDNNWGFQPTHSGIAYCGIIQWYGPPFPPDYREYIEIGLISPLIANTCYHFEMYVSLAEASQTTVDRFHVLLSDTAITGQFDLYAFTPQIDINPGWFTDTLNWTLLSANYTAQGGENYLIIGNFLNNTLCPTQSTGFGIFPEAYFFIDDVSLTPCTGIEEQNEEAIKIYPNPVKDLLNVQIPNSKFQTNKTEIKITDILGKEILRKQFSKSKIQNPKQFENWNLNIENFKPGIYFIEINSGKNIYRKKFLKIGI